MGMEIQEIVRYLDTLLQNRCEQNPPFEKRESRLKNLARSAYEKYSVKRGREIKLSDAALTAQELINTNLPKPKRLLGPISESSLCLLYGPRGIGKTHLGLEIALSIAFGETKLVSKKLDDPPNWDIEGSKTNPVLIIDGEMPLHALKERLKFAAKVLPEDLQLHYLTADMVWRKFDTGISLAAKDFQILVDNYIEGIPGLKFILLDNIGSLVTGINEDKKEELEPFSQWLFNLRYRGIAVMQIHHTNKAGEQRGTSFREDQLDLSIELKQPTGWEPGERASFDVVFRKTRAQVGDLVRPFNATYENGEWEFESLEKMRVEELVEIVEENGEWNWREVAKKMKVGRSRVFKLRQDAIDQGFWRDEWGLTVGGKG